MQTVNKYLEDTQKVMEDSPTLTASESALAMDLQAALQDMAPLRAIKDDLPTLKEALARSIAFGEHSVRLRVSRVVSYVTIGGRGRRPVTLLAATCHLRVTDHVHTWHTKDHLLSSPPLVRHRPSTSPEHLQYEHLDIGPLDKVRTDWNNRFHAVTRGGSESLGSNDSSFDWMDASDYYPGAGDLPEHCLLMNSRRTILVYTLLPVLGLAAWHLAVVGNDLLESGSLLPSDPSLQHVFSTSPFLGPKPSDP
jgi:hypothetical protein